MEIGKSFFWKNHGKLAHLRILAPKFFHEDFLLYLTIAESTIGIVMVQEGDALCEHVIYYLSRGLVGPKLQYSPVEKLALGVVHVFQ